MKRWIWTLLVLLYVGFIFSNSMTPATESSRQSGAVLALVLDWLRAVGMDGAWVTEHLIRKTAHFVEYAFLGVLLWECLKAHRLERRFGVILQAWLGTMIPLVDETIQLFTVGRSGQVSDVWLDMAGVAAGTCAAIIVCTQGRKDATKTAGARKQGAK